MKFSIIIPVYNGEKSIARCLKSVIEQTYDDFEAIIVDDGSIDNTENICKEFIAHDSRLRYLYHTNSGVSYTRNKGISEAKGDYLVFLDSDDSYECDYLLRFNEMIETFPDCDNYWCCYKVHDEQGAYITSCGLINDSQKFIHADKKQIMNYHTITLDAALWNKAFKRHIITANSLCMIDDLSLGEDLIFNFQYLDVASPNIVIYNSPLYNYTKSQNYSLDSKFRPDLKETFDIIDNFILDHLKKWNVSADQMKIYYNSVFYSQEKVLYNTYRPECLLTKYEKIKFNNAVLKSKKFKEAIHKSNCYINPLYRFAYLIGEWRVVMLLDKLISIKKSL